jgi:cytochrome c oxidase subunit III
MTDTTATPAPPAIAALQEPWPNLALQREGVGVGMWVFLMSEILFFAALFCTYSVYRSFNPQAFQIAGAHTEIVYGAINTVILLTSSLTMTIALRAATEQLRRLTLVCLVVTAALGLAFLAVKGLEYHDDVAKGLVPGAGFALSPPQTELFWMLYWIMTGIHAIHLSAGVLVVAAVVVLFARRIIPVQGSTMEGIAIYWHFVDSVWLVLFPLLYLGGRS